MCFQNIFYAAAGIRSGAVFVIRCWLSEYKKLFIYNYVCVQYRVKMFRMDTFNYTGRTITLLRRELKVQRKYAFFIILPIYNHLYGVIKSVFAFL